MPGSSIIVSMFITSVLPVFAPFSIQLMACRIRSLPESDLLLLYPTGLKPALFTF